MLRLPEMAPVQYEVTALNGGLDQVTSAYALQPGALRDCVNFACKPHGGYYRIDGYERFDGRIQPHTATFITIATILNPGESIVVGDYGQFGNINGTVCYVDPFGLYVGLTKTTTTYAADFVPGPIILYARNIGDATAVYTQLDLQLLAIIKASAADIYRNDIQAVPGSGPIRGVVTLNDIAYAFRDNAAGDAGDIYKATSGGWEKVILGSIISFDEFTPFPPTDETGTITQGVVTATYSRLVVDGPGTTTTKFKGRAIITSVVGGTLTADAFTTDKGGAGTFTDTLTPISRLPGGNCDFSVGNFFSQESTRRIYGADGVNDGFEFDNTNYVPIPVAGLSEKPGLAIVHANHLFFAVGASIIHSAIGDPYNFTVIAGAGEIGTGGRITGMLILPGSQATQALVVYARHSTWILYGTGSDDWNFTNYNVGVGAWEYTTQNLFDAYGVDDRGLTSMKQSLNYGNFDAETVTYNIQKFIDSKRGKATCSGLSRENSQYRAYFNDGYGLYTTLSSQGVVGHGIILFPNIPLVYWDGDYSTGQTIALFGDKDGMVYRNDVGTSFDGAPITSYLNTNINSAKSPRIRKRFRRAVIEMQGTSYVDMNVGYMFDWSTPNILPHDFVPGNLEFASLKFWDSFVWDSFFWDGRTQDTVPVELNGTGENLQMMIISNTNYVESFVLSSVVFHYSQRRGSR